MGNPGTDGTTPLLNPADSREHPVRPRLSTKPLSGIVSQTISLKYGNFAALRSNVSVWEQPDQVESANQRILNPSATF